MGGSFLSILLAYCYFYSCYSFRILLFLSPVVSQWSPFVPEAITELAIYRLGLLVGTVP